LPYTYDVDPKTDSREALEAFKSSADKYDLVITDQKLIRRVLDD
jgi:hypothetical protein